MVLVEGCSEVDDGVQPSDGGHDWNSRCRLDAELEHHHGGEVIAPWNDDVRSGGEESASVPVRLGTFRFTSDLEQHLAAALDRCVGGDVPVCRVAVQAHLAEQMHAEVREGANIEHGVEHAGRGGGHHATAQELDPRRVRGEPQTERRLRLWIGVQDVGLDDPHPESYRWLGFLHVLEHLGSVDEEPNLGREARQRVLPVGGGEGGEGEENGEQEQCDDTDHDRLLPNGHVPAVD